jgi:hypothetical protein
MRRDVGIPLPARPVSFIPPSGRFPTVSRQPHPFRSLDTSAYPKPPLPGAMPIPPSFTALQPGPCEGQLRPRRLLNAAVSSSEPHGMVANPKDTGHASNAASAALAYPHIEKGQVELFVFVPNLSHEGQVKRPAGLRGHLKGAWRVSNEPKTQRASGRNLR